MTKTTTNPVKTLAPHPKSTVWERFVTQKQLFLLLLPGVLFYLIFHYLPMCGLVIAFKDYGLWTGIWDSPWVGLEHFQRFFSSPDFLLLFKNTVSLGFFTLLFGFPFPILFALMINELKNAKFRSFSQTISYLPSFLSVVVVCSMLIDMLSPQNGILTQIFMFFGVDPHYYITDPKWFRVIYVASEVWKQTGFNAIIYVAALSGIDPQLYEAAKMDGCSRLKSIWYVTLPGILPTVATMFIIRSGDILRVGYEKVLLLYNPATYEVADIFATYVYRQGIMQQNYSYASAVGVFESLAALTVVLAANMISKKLSENGLW